jgi:hypothetical protein
VSVFKRSKEREKVSLGETLNVLRRYVIQETIAPLKQLGKVLGLGLAGSFLIGLGALLVVIGFLRLLQGEAGSTFSGNWSFAPYLLTVVFAVLLVTVLGAVFFRRRSSSDGSNARADAIKRSS